MSTPDNLRDARRAVADTVRILQGTKTLHFIGIGGIGMSALAAVMHASGSVISGSDACENAQTQRLKHIGCTVHIGHDACHVPKNSLVVYSNAVPFDNVERRAAVAYGNRCVTRAVLLAAVCTRFRTIAVAGTHGKTTTASLLAAILHTAELSPTYLLGGLPHNIGNNAALGKSEWCVVEADESDHAFLLLSPHITVITNIDDDHMTVFANDAALLDRAFADVAARTDPNGAVFLCCDDPRTRALHTKHVHANQITYGTGDDMTVRACNRAATADGNVFSIYDRRQSDMHDVCDTPFHTRLFGIHNVRNTTAAIAVARHIGIDDAAIGCALSVFTGIKRRFQHFGTVSFGAYRMTVVDDYAHHPTEITATVDAARQRFGTAPVIAVVEPHRYTRLAEHSSGFADALAACDAVIVCPVYAASEPPIAGIDHYMLRDAVSARGVRNVLAVDSLDAIADACRAIGSDGAVLVSMGAGTIRGAIEKLYAAHAVD